MNPEGPTHTACLSLPPQTMPAAPAVLRVMLGGAAAGTDPLDADTDGDGLLDGEDAEPTVPELGDSGEGNPDKGDCGCSSSEPAGTGVLAVVLLGVLVRRRRSTGDRHEG